jgi:hypothetical protein
LVPTPPARSDGWLAALAIVHGVLALAAPSVPLFAIALWWNANTISHAFIHRPYFQRRAANGMFAAYESVLLGIPQAIWSDRHLAHHARRPARMRWSREAVLQIGLVLTLWTAMAARDPRFFVRVYLPGYLGGLLLCAVHGHYEHVRGTASHYGIVYNVLFFNDGYHVEHHGHPRAHWSALPQLRDATARRSTWPAVLRWMEAFTLEGLERAVVRSPILQRFVIAAHRRALRPLVGDRVAPNARIAIIGGGLFPRTALILRELLPNAGLTVIDASLENLACARAFLNDNSIAFVHARYPADDDAAQYDAVVIPLAFDGDRGAIYERPPARTVIVHDWLWCNHGVSRVVSVVLLKRINLVDQQKVTTL